MPYVRVQIIAGRTDDQKAELAEAITGAMERIIGSNPASTIVVFEDVSKENWAIGGTLVSRRTVKT
jgi:4-oxalocrotonate tautomerase